MGMAASFEIGGRRAVYADEDLLAPAAAAAIAECSVRTIRRAYSSGLLLAYRDANGRGVRIRYGDLRAWMMREPVAVKPLEAATAPHLVCLLYTSPSPR